MVSSAVDPHLTPHSHFESIRTVHVISRKALRSFADEHEDAETPLDDWYRTVKRANWNSIVDVRKTYPHADAVGEFTVFNIGGNKYRLATYIRYGSQRIYIRRVMTHEEYSRGDWKRQ